ncbi:MAG: hypothetical protein WBA57_03120 [Elainellaceae cyanobacterium]
MQRIPWISFGLLLAAYSTFSWFLYSLYLSWAVWVLVIAFALFEALLLTAFADTLKAVIDTWLRSDLGYFTSVIVTALFVAFAFVWIRSFSYILVVVSAEMLARLDLQNAGFNRAHSLIFLTVISLAGLALGQAASRLIIS